MNDVGFVLDMKKPVQQLETGSPSRCLGTKVADSFVLSSSVGTGQNPEQVNPTPQLPFLSRFELKSIPNLSK